MKKLIPPSQKEAKNKDAKTPKMVFRDAHQQLMKDGEKWMKTTATSCKVAAALIAMVAFAAVMHAPEGKTLLLTWDLECLLVFISHCHLNVLINPQFLTLRYSQDDFLYALPRGLTIGLSMLFISIFTMIAALAAAIILYCLVV